MTIIILTLILTMTMIIAANLNIGSGIMKMEEMKNDDN